MKTVYENNIMITWIINQQFLVTALLITQIMVPAITDFKDILIVM
jgi:hypothetical protein